MATQIGSASLSSDFYILPITGILDEDPLINLETGSLVARNTTTWNDLAGLNWGEVAEWVGDTAPIRHTTPVLDVGSIQQFTLDIQTDIVGTVKYYIYVSNTGEFAGEESETFVQTGQTVGAFTGRYARVSVSTNAKSIEAVTVTANSATFEQQLTNIDTSTLGGTVAERVLALDNPVSGIIEMTIDVQDTTPYTQDVYVTDYPSSEVLIPIVKSKGLAPTFALYGLDNVPRDGIVDINIIAMPQMQMVGNNLLSNR